MTLNGNTRPGLDQVLQGLKDFQRTTVEYVFRRLYCDPHPTSRFLIADEVGLGKTLVARGVIAKAIDHLWDTTERIDVVYICSNQEIARQNIDRLNVTEDRHFQFASRSTLLPVTLQALRGNKLNFVSLTPGTSFDLRSRAGWMHERAVLFYLLRDVWTDRTSIATLSNILRAGVKRENWDEHLRHFRAAHRRVQDETLLQIDQELASAFRTELARSPQLGERYEQLADEIGSRRSRLPAQVRQARDRLIGDLRHLLARSSLSALEPDLVILDEFQRFKFLLEQDNELALLAQELFRFPDVKVLLLSATPYKMYTLHGEIGEDHYEDFLRTVSFLLVHAPETIETLKGAVDTYRRAMFHLASDGQDQMRTAKHTIEQVLRQVMVRTERLAASADRNGMLTERVTAQGHLHANDLDGFTQLDRIAQAIEAGDQMEYWKSAAYPLNLMEGYKLKRKLQEALRNGESSGIGDLLARSERHMLSWQNIQSYQPLDPANARLRALLQDTVDTGSWRLLWLPPSLPYYRLAGPFASVAAAGLTKTLVFSTWRLAPKTIAVVASYETERQMLANATVDLPYAELVQRRRPLLVFKRDEGRLTGLSVFCLIYPCMALARLIDPLAVARRLSDGNAPDADQVLHHVQMQVSQLLERATADLAVSDDGRTDERWYWAALALLDRHFHPDQARDWLASQDTDFSWAAMLVADPEEAAESQFAEHVREFSRVFEQPEPLGRQPEDLIEVLAHIALAAPAVTALRSLLRTIPSASDASGGELVAAAARAGLAFRSLFNQPESIVLLDQWYPDEPYWLKTLRYCRDGNLQAVLDEYLHVLLESLGLIGHSATECSTKMGKVLEQALTIRAPTLRFDEIKQESGVWTISEPRSRPGLRCRYALRFGDEKGADYDGRTRDVDVRIAFNSPFRPFILATTSIGQEGLDFHQYCHRVVHWNLPSNPVDLEQREGRVHRYKGHVVRRNLAQHYGLARLEVTKEGLIDPWRQLFEFAIQDRPAGSNDLWPFWIYETEGGVTIERIVPTLPLSREIGHLDQLKRSLVAYRSVIGQPRQQELLEYLTSRLSPSELSRIVDEFAVDLSPALY